jgi:PAS domain S-box-containing protein
MGRRGDREPDANVSELDTDVPATGNRTSGALLPAEILELRLRLEEAEDTIRAIRGGEIDAFVISGDDHDQVYTLESADRPYRLFVEQMIQGAAMLDSAGIVLFCNGSFAAMLEQDRTRLIGTPLSQLVRPSSRSPYDTLFLPGSNAARQAEVAFERSHGIAVTALVTASRLPNDDSLTCLIVSDLTEQRYYDRLARAERTLQLALDAAVATVFTWDIATDQVRRLYDRRLTQVATTADTSETFESFVSAVQHEDRAGLVAAVELALAGAGDYRAEYRMNEIDGSTRWLSERGRVEFDAAQEPVSLSGLSIDVTERRLAEENLRRAHAELESRVTERTADLEAAMRAKGDFLANMSHEIRTPMNGVIGMADLLLDTQMTGLQRGYAETIRTSGDALLTVINDILDLSKIEAGKMRLELTNFDLGTVMEEVAELLAPRAHEKGLRMTCRLDPRIPVELIGDPSRIRQILTNLAGNAVKFTERGEVNLEAQLVHELSGQVTVRTLVTDTGIGVPPDQRDIIFESFTQLTSGSSRKHGGTGLGLTICRHLVTLMNGTIGVESDRDEGSTFWFELTFSVHSGGAGAAVPVTSLQGARVLITDMQSTERRILIELLHSWGCRAEETIGVPLTRRDDQPYALVLFDRAVAEVDGWKLPRTMKMTHPFADVPFVLLTSPRLSAAGDTPLGLFSAAIAKPVRRWHLHDVIRATLARPPAGGQQDPVRSSKIQALASSMKVLVAEDNEVNRRVAVGLLERLGCQAVVVQTAVTLSKH